MMTKKQNVDFSKIKFTDYCTCFNFRDEKGYGVQVFDEIKDKPIKTIRVRTSSESTVLADDIVKYAQENNFNCFRL